MRCQTIPHLYQGLHFLFNPLQIDAQFDGAAAISIKEPVATGKNHGVFLNDGHDYVKCFLHKQTEERLREMGAVNKAGNVDLDTGAIHHLTKQAFPPGSWMELLTFLNKLIK